MEFNYFSKNGILLPTEEAAIPLSNIEYQYGFGVYETIRVTAGIPYFLKQHLERLQESAQVIGLEHTFTQTFVEQAIQELIEKNTINTCNLKILLIGRKSADEATLYMLCLNPLFPDKKLYRDGVHCITVSYERLFPHAKTLNMLGSYLAYKKARAEDAYEALLVNRDGNITEGTRTNFYVIRGKTIISPPASHILPGVTQMALQRTAAECGYAYREQNLPIVRIVQENAFITSTSSKILPIRSIDSHTLPEISTDLRDLMNHFDAFLERSKGFLS